MKLFLITHYPHTEDNIFVIGDVITGFQDYLSRVIRHEKLILEKQ